MLQPQHNNRQNVNIRTAKTLEQQKDIVYLIKDYYKAMINSKPLPNESLPSIDDMLLATRIVDAYLKASNLGLSLKLYNACLTAEKVIAVWLFANEPTLNVKIGSYQLIALNHN